jgi:hypothetical protein
VRLFLDYCRNVRKCNCRLLIDCGQLMTQRQDARHQRQGLFSASAGCTTRKPPGEISLYQTPLDRRRDAIAFGEMVITDAHQRFNNSDPR